MSQFSVVSIEFYYNASVVWACVVIFLLPPATALPRSGPLAPSLVRLAPELVASGPRGTQPPGPWFKAKLISPSKTLSNDYRTKSPLT